MKKKIVNDSLTTKFSNLMKAANKNAQRDFKNISKDITNNIASLKETITGMNDVLNEICGPEKNDNCTVTDFNNQGDKSFVADRIVRCRVKYKLVNNILTKRAFTEKYKLKKYLEATNSLRRELPSGSAIGVGKKAFGFIIIDNLFTFKKSAYPLSVDIKGMSGSKIDPNLKDFAPSLPSDELVSPQDMYPLNPNGRVFHVQYFGIRKEDGIDIPISRGYDTEPNMLEEVARLYWKNGKQRVNMELFTDKETCGGCESLITKINSGLEQTGYKFVARKPRELAPRMNGNKQTRTEI